MASCSGAIPSTSIPKICWVLGLSLIWNRGSSFWSVERMTNSRPSSGVLESSGPKLTWKVSSLLAADVSALTAGTEPARGATVWANNTIAMATAGEIAAPAEYRRFTLYDCFFVNMGGSITLAIEIADALPSRVCADYFRTFWPVHVVLVRSGPFPLQTDRTPIVPVARHRFQGVTKCRLPIFGTPLDR